MKRAESVEYKTRSRLSCSRLKQTSPRALLAQLKYDGIDQNGWIVCRMDLVDRKKEPQQEAIRDRLDALL